MRIALLVALLGSAFVVGYVGGAHTGAEPNPSTPPSSAEPSRDPPPAARGIGEAELRRIVREEMAVLPRAATEAPSPSVREDARADEAAAEPAPAAAVAAFDAGAQRVRNAIAARQWTREDAQMFARELNDMTPQQRDEVLQTLVPALNRGEIRRSYRGPLF